MDYAFDSCVRWTRTDVAPGAGDRTRLARVSTGVALVKERPTWDAFAGLASECASWLADLGVADPRAALTAAPTVPPDDHALDAELDRAARRLMDTADRLAGTVARLGAFALAGAAHALAYAGRRRLLMDDVLVDLAGAPRLAALWTTPVDHPEFPAPRAVRVPGRGGGYGPPVPDGIVQGYQPSFDPAGPLLVVERPRARHRDVVLASRGHVERIERVYASGAVEADILERLWDGLLGDNVLAAVRTAIEGE